MGGLLHDIGSALRQLFLRPGYSVAVLLTLGIGIALTAGMYTVLRGVVLQGLPYPGGERVVAVTTDNAEQGVTGGGSLTPAEVDALGNVDDVFEHFGWFTWAGATVLSGDRPREFTINNVGLGFFPALGVQPLVGRWPTAEDIASGSSPVLLSYVEWDRLTGRNPGIVGQPLQLTDRTVTVIGVMPPDFTEPSRQTGFWHAVDPSVLASNQGVYLNARYVRGIGLLKEGVSADQARARLEAMSLGLHAEHGITSAWRIGTTSLLEFAIGDVRGALVGVFIVSLVVLAIACANAGALLAARLAARQRELAVMQALGATSGRVWRGILVEMSVLGIFGAAIAVVLLFIGLDAFKSLADGIIPLARMIELDTRALVFAAGIAVLCPLVITFPIAMRLRRHFAENLQGAGKGTAKGTRGVTVLPVVGLALATAALIAGGAMLASLQNMHATDPGYRTSGIHAVQMFKGGGPDSWRSFGAAVAAEMNAQHDVEDVAITTAAPMSLIGSFTIDLQVPTRELPEPMEVGLRRVSPNYLDMLAVPVLRGRGFTDADDVAAPNVAIINETLARRVFGEQDPVGRDIALPLGRDGRVNYRVVGISADIRNGGLRNPPEPEVLLPFMQTPWVGMTFLVDAPRAGDDLIERLQQAIWAHDPEEATTRIYQLQDDVDVQAARVAFFSRMLGGFAVLAALLAAFGTYSVIALVQRQRTTEIGIRLALGADPARIARHVLHQGTLLALVAGAIGSLGAYAVLRLLANQLFGVAPADIGLYLFGILAVALTAFAASALPAWRSARVDPNTALHYE